MLDRFRLFKLFNALLSQKMPNSATDTTNMNEKALVFSLLSEGKLQNTSGEPSGGSGGGGDNDSGDPPGSSGSGNGNKFRRSIW